MGRVCLVLQESAKLPSRQQHVRIRVVPHPRQRSPSLVCGHSDRCVVVSHQSVIIINQCITSSCAGSLLLHAGVLQVWRAWGTLGHGAQAARGGGSSGCGPLDGRAQELRQHRLSGPVARGNPPSPGANPTSPERQGGVWVTGTPGKSSHRCFSAQFPDDVWYWASLHRFQLCVFFAEVPIQLLAHF